MNRLWIDDDKPAPPGWSTAKTYDAALHQLYSRSWDIVAIDHDLADEDHDETTGYKLLCLMESGALPLPKSIAIISWNAVGARRMLQVLERLNCTNLGWDLPLSTSGWREKDKPSI